MKQYYRLITSEKPRLNTRLKELWQYRDLILLLTKRHFVVFYKQTILGPLWVIINPILSSVLYMLVFGNIAKLSTDGVPQLLLYFASTSIWSFFSSCVTRTANTFSANAHVFGTVYFPRLTNPIATVLSAGINFFVQMLMFSFFWVYFILKGQAAPHWFAIAALPVVLLVMGCMALGCGIIVSSLTTKYRDLAIVVSFGVSLWMYATPVVYPLSTASGKMRTLLLANPVTPMMELFRYMFLGQGQISLPGLIWSAVFTVIVLMGGILLFNRVEKTFMDTV